MWPKMWALLRSSWLLSTMKLWSGAVVVMVVVAIGGVAWDGKVDVVWKTYVAYILVML